MQAKQFCCWCENNRAWIFIFWQPNWQRQTDTIVIIFLCWVCFGSSWFVSFEISLARWSSRMSIDSYSQSFSLYLLMLKFDCLHLSNLLIICSYLEQHQKIFLSHLNTKLRYIITNEGFWVSYKISNYEQWSLYLNWFGKYVESIKPSRLEIDIRLGNQFKYTEFQSLFVSKMPFIEELSFYCQYQDSYFRSLLSILKTAKIKTLQTEILPEKPLRPQNKNGQKLQLQDLYDNLCYLQHLSVIGQRELYEASKINLLPSLKSLVLKSHELHFSEINKFIKRSSDQLEILEIDCQNYPAELFSVMIGFLKPFVLKKLRFYHLENIPQQCFLNLANIENLLELVITKTYQIYNRTFSLVFTKTKWLHLTVLDLTQAIYLEDDSLIALLQKSTKLKTVRLAWCTKLNSFSINYLISHCLQLQVIILTGVKQLTNNAFEEIEALNKLYLKNKFAEIKSIIKKQRAQGNPHFDVDYNQFFEKPVCWETLKHMRNLKELDCVSCDYLSTSLLEIISLYRSNAIVRDYYSEQINLYSNSMFDD